MKWRVMFEDEDGIVRQDFFVEADTFAEAMRLAANNVTTSREIVAVSLWADLDDEDASEGDAT